MSYGYLDFVCNICGKAFLGTDGAHCPHCWNREYLEENRAVSESTKLTNPKDAVATNRIDLSLFPTTARAYGALAAIEGDLKYGGYNWRRAGVLASVYYSAANRHLDKWFDGEWADSETGVPHLASALMSIAILIDAKECDMLQDDRPPVRVSKMYRAMEEIVRRLRDLFPNGPKRSTEVE